MRRNLVAQPVGAASFCRRYWLQIGQYWSGSVQLGARLVSDLADRRNYGRGLQIDTRTKNVPTMRGLSSALTTLSREGERRARVE
jgi:hypothetical protein